MLGMGPLEVLMILFMAGGGLNTDLASVVPAQSYFKSRAIEIDVEKAADFAGKDPVDGKAQIAQLIALRYLADEPAKLKASPNYLQHRQLLSAIAAGKKANDPQGFAKEYAGNVLARLDGTKLPLATAPSVREDPFRWFPANANLIGTLDMRLARGEIAAKSNLGELLKVFPDEALKAMCGAVEKVGNVRIDRIAFAYVANPQDQGKGEIYVRLTGKANTAWLLGAFKEMNVETKTSKGPGGETITKLIMPRQVVDGPAITFIGDNDLVVAGYAKDKANHEVLLDKVLDLRGGKLKHAAEGLLKGELAKVPEKAVGLLVGSLPAEAAVGAPFPLPVMISGHILRTQNALDINFAGGMANNEDAVALVKQVSQFRTEGINGLKQLQGAPVPIPGLQIGPLIQMLESMQVEAQGSVAKLRLLMPDDVVLGSGMMFGFAARAAQLPPPAKEEKK